MKVLRNRFIVGSLCILLGLVVGFVAIPRLAGSVIPETATVIRLKSDLAKGDSITPNDIELVQFEKQSLPGGFLSDQAELNGRYAIADLFAGDFLTSAKLTDRSEHEDPMLRATARDLKIISISLPALATSVSGKLKPGDIVTIIALPQKNTTERTQMLAPDPSANQSSDSEEGQEISLNASMNTVIYPELRFLEVCSIHATDGSAARVLEYPGNDQKNSLPQTISLFVTEKQALRLAELEQRGVIHLCFVARAEDADRYISPDKLVFGEVNRHATSDNRP